MHMNITIRITEEPQQKYCLGTVRNRFLGVKHVLLDPNPRPLILHCKNSVEFMVG